MKIINHITRDLLIIFASLTFALSACGKVEEESVINALKPSPAQTKTEVQTESLKFSDLPTVALKTTSSLVTSEGLQNVTFGMTEFEANTAFKGGLQKLPDFNEPSENYNTCYNIYPKAVDYMKEFTVSFMVVSGKIQRIDVGSPDIATERGAKIGMSFESIEALYPNAQRQPNFYTFPNQDLIVQLENDTKIIFEQGANEIVSKYRVGKVPAVEFVEGCL